MQFEIAFVGSANMNLALPRRTTRMLATLAIPLCAVTAALATVTSPVSARAQDARDIRDEPVIATPSSTSVRLTGTVYRYDGAAHRVVLRTSEGLQAIALTARTQIRDGGHALEAEQLGARLGMRVIVRVREVAGGPEAVSVHFLAKPASDDAP